MEGAALQFVKSFRRRDRLAIARGRRNDGSIPSTSIDTTTLLCLLKQWADWAQQRGELLFVYGHRELEDEVSVTGRIAGIEGPVLLAARELPPLRVGEEYTLVPDERKKALDSAPLSVKRVEGRNIYLGVETSGVTSVGAEFLLGPSYGTRLSDFRDLMQYASRRLAFYTVSEALGLVRSSDGEIEFAAPCHSTAVP